MLFCRLSHIGGLSKLVSVGLWTAEACEGLDESGWGK